MRPGGGLFFDADDDGDLDLADWVSLADCLLGPAVAAGSGCVVHDFTRDGAVDLADVAEFQRYFSGEGNPASVACRRAGSYAHDADGDRDVDIDDYVSYESCLAAPPGPGLCLAFHDFDGAGESDGDVDLDDFGGLLNCFSGSGETPPPDCFRPAPEGVPPGPGSFALHGGMVDVLSSGREGPEDALDDFAGFASCLATPAGPGAPGTGLCLAFHDANAVPARREADGHVDLEDFAGLQHCFSGSGQPPPPDCFRPAPEGVPPASGSFALHGGMVDVLSTGREGPEDALALQYSRARYFDLRHGRFLQRDPTGYADGSNLYEAFGSNPARFVDPHGLFGLERGHQRIFPRTGDNCYQPWDYIPNVADIEAPNRFGLFGRDGAALDGLELAWECRSVIIERLPTYTRLGFLHILGTNDDLTGMTNAQLDIVIEKELMNLFGAWILLRAHTDPNFDFMLRQCLDPDVYAMFGRADRRDLSLGYVQGAAYAAEGATDIAIGLANQCLDLYVNQFVTRLSPGAEIRIPKWRFAPEWIKVSDRTKEWSRFLGGNAIITLATVGADKCVRWVKAAKDASLLEDPVWVRPLPPKTAAPNVRTLTPVADPAPPVYEVGHPGQLVQDHTLARAAGGHPTSPANLRTVPWEMNARKGALEGQLLQYEQELIRGGLTPAQARAVTASEWQALQRDALPRPMDPRILEQIPAPGSR